MGKWFAKLRNGKFSPGIAFTICTNEFHLPENGQERPETDIKDGFEKMELEFPFRIFHPEKQDYLFRCSVAPGNFLLERPKKVVPVFHLLSNRNSRKIFVNGKQSISLSLFLNSLMV